MQRSKQQALMFLLGAVLVGGVLGFSAERVMSKKPPRTSARSRMYDDIGITPEQRVKMDSILDETNCKTGDLMSTIKPALDSVHAAGRKSIIALMTPQQQAAFNARQARFTAYVDSVEKARAARGDSGDRSRRCGGASGPGIGPGAGQHRGTGGPGGPFF
jgi:hypothetical protein